MKHRRVSNATLVYAKQNDEMHDENANKPRTLCYSEFDAAGKKEGSTSSDLAFSSKTCAKYNDSGLPWNGSKRNVKDRE